MTDTWRLTGDGVAVLTDPRGEAVPFDSEAARVALRASLTPEARLVVESAGALELVALGALPWAAVEAVASTEASQTVVTVSDERPAPEPELDAEPEPEPEPAEIETAEPKSAAAAPEAVVKRVAPPAAAPSEFTTLAVAVLKVASWFGAEHSDTQRAVHAALACPDADPQRIAKHISHGDKQFRALSGLDALLIRMPPDAPEARRHIAELRQAFGRNKYVLGKIDRAIDRATTRFARASQVRDGSAVRAGNVAHALPRIAPSPAWTLLIDEGGEFSAVASGQVLSGGKVVGLLVPEGAALPPLPTSWHAVDQTDLGEIDRVVQTALDAPVGILGLRTEALVGSFGDPWLTAVLELVGWVIRLVPLDGPTRIEVLVEQRGEHAQGTRWQAGAVAVRRMLAEVDPERAAQIDLGLRLIGKSDSPWNGYVDALAFTWTSQTRPSKARLKQSGLRGSCLMNQGGADAAIVRDAIHAPDALPPSLWTRLIALPEAVDTDSLVSLVLARAQQACRRSPGVWRRYLEATQQHLEGKAIGLVVLGRQVEFLAGCAPEGTVLTPVQQLAWSVARLETANHRGEVADDTGEAMEHFGHRLFDELPTLVCQGDLDAAVMHTNAFRFDAATRALARWATQQMAVPGRQHWGRVQSSLGQHAAFRGDTAAALAYFRVALEAFDGLSDPDTAAAERRHTQTYVALVAMDAPPDADVDARAEVERICSLAPEGVHTLAASTRPADRYAHHVLVRWLWERGSSAERSEYLTAAEQSGLKRGEGHPWPLIQAYRAAMLVEAGRRDAARPLLEMAIDDALDGGPTLRFIAATLAQFATRLFGETPPDMRTATASLRAALPSAPWSVFDDASRRDPREYLRAVLPFNFR